MKIGILGAGLFGRIIGLHLKNMSHEVKMFDPGLARSGLAAAGCLMKPSWMSNIPNYPHLLDRLADITRGGVSKRTFSVLNPVHTVAADCYVLDKDRLVDLTESMVTQASGKILQSSKMPPVIALPDFGRMQQFDYVLDCRGSWLPGTQYREGVSFESISRLVGSPTIKPWRPFTQLVKFQMPNGRIWSGDGTAVKELTVVQEIEAQERVRKFLDMPDMKNFLTIRGRRPYPMKRLSSGQGAEIRWNNRVATVGGGAKNGTIGAMWAAVEIGKAIP